MNVLSKFKGWKTLIFNIVMLLASSPELLALIPPDLAVHLIPIINVLLRLKTNTPVGKAAMVSILTAALVLVPVPAHAQSSLRPAVADLINTPTMTITGGTVDSSSFPTAGIGQLLIQMRFGTVAGTYTTCTIQVKTAIDNGANYLTIGSATAITVTTGTINTWVIGGTNSTSVSASVSPAFGLRSRLSFACSGGYGTSAPVTINLVGTPINGSGNVPVVIAGSSSGGATPGSWISDNSATEVIIKAASGSLKSISVTGTLAAAYYVRAYDDDDPDCSSATGIKQRWIIAADSAGSGVALPIPASGIQFAVGISLCATTNISDTGTTAIGSNVVTISYSYD